MTSPIPRPPLPMAPPPQTDLAAIRSVDALPPWRAPEAWATRLAVASHANLALLAEAGLLEDLVDARGVDLVVVQNPTLTDAIAIAHLIPVWHERYGARDGRDDAWGMVFAVWDRARGGLSSDVRAALEDTARVQRAQGLSSWSSGLAHAWQSAWSVETWADAWFSCLQSPTRRRDTTVTTGDLLPYWAANPTVTAEDRRAFITEVAPRVAPVPDGARALRPWVMHWITRLDSGRTASERAAQLEACRQTEAFQALPQLAATVPAADRVAWLGALEAASHQSGSPGAFWAAVLPVLGPVWQDWVQDPEFFVALQSHPATPVRHWGVTCDLTRGGASGTPRIATPGRSR